MKVTEHLARADHPLISFEIIPPLRGGNLGQLLDLIEELARFHPPFIDITSHAAEVIYDEGSDGGVTRRVKRKRPGTLGLCALIQNKYGIDAVPHILCQGFSREETEDFLIELRYLGIDNVLAVRGDDSGFAKPLQYGRSANPFAVDLVHQVRGLSAGHYMQADLLDAEPLDFCIGIGGYPEKHFEAPNLLTDVRRAKEKVDAGADYIVTQMFFDNRHYFRYVELCRQEGIEVPIIPGLKILTTKAQLATIPRNFYVEIPAALVDAIAAAPERTADVGIEWAQAQVEELFAHDVPAVHFYVMQTAKAVTKLMERLAIVTPAVSAGVGS